MFLLDTDCTTNIIGQHVHAFDHLPEVDKQRLHPYKSVQALLTDRSTLPFYGKIMLKRRRRDVAIKKYSSVESSQAMPYYGYHSLARMNGPIIFSDLPSCSEEGN